MCNDTITTNNNCEAVNELPKRETIRNQLDTANDVLTMGNAIVKNLYAFLWAENLPDYDDENDIDCYYSELSCVVFKSKMLCERLLELSQRFGLEN